MLQKDKILIFAQNRTNETPFFVLYIGGFFFKSQIMPLSSKHEECPFSVDGSKMTVQKYFQIRA